MTNKEHSQLRANLTNWTMEDLAMVKSLVEIEIMERNLSSPEYQEWMQRFIQGINDAPRHLAIVK